MKYTVKAGDTLSALALKYHLTVRVICEWNKISDPNLIKVGQTLNLPVEEADNALSTMAQHAINLMPNFVRNPLWNKVASKWGGNVNALITSLTEKDPVKRAVYTTWNLVSGTLGMFRFAQGPLLVLEVSSIIADLQKISFDSFSSLVDKQIKNKDEAMQLKAICYALTAQS